MSLVLETRQLSKRFVLRHNARDVKSRALGLLRASERARREEFWALRSVSLRVSAGESVGLVGRNGSGKSTLLKVIAGIHRPTGGQMLVRHGVRISSMIELGTGFHPELTGQENVLLNTSIHGLTRAEAMAIYERVVAYSGLRHFMDVPIKNYSSGMHMRLGFAIAANLDPDVLLLDEIFAVGDEEFQRQCMGTLEGFLEAGKTILFVSHSAAAVQAICRRVCVLERGQLRFDGDVDSGLTEYRRLTAASPHQPLGSDGDVSRRSGDADVSRSSGEAAKAEAAWHRLATGGRWEEEGAWVFDFLRRHGLHPDHYLLEMGCGSLSAASRLLPYMDQSHYWGFEKNVELFVAGVEIELPRANVRPERGHFIVNDDFDLSSAPHAFDLAIAGSLLRRLPLNGVARCFASVIRKLTPGGTFFVAWAEPGDDPFAPKRQADGTETLGERPPYHYDFGVLARMVEIAGGRAERLPDRTHPRGDSIMAITRG
jgi:ABC-type polysaccharide/polyol phosphate transport system ATPase subunit/SAM-dependent methyltransferase